MPTLSVADWSQAGVCYTVFAKEGMRHPVADWSQAGVCYTEMNETQLSITVADWSQAGVCYTAIDDGLSVILLRIGLRPGFVTLSPPISFGWWGCGLVSGRGLLHLCVCVSLLV